MTAPLTMLGLAMIAGVAGAQTQHVAAQGANGSSPPITVAPTAAMNNTGQLAQSPGVPASPTSRATFQDLQVATGVHSTQERDGWTFDGVANALGVPNRRGALRFVEGTSQAALLLSALFHRATPGVAWPTLTYAFGPTGQLGSPVPEQFAGEERVAEFLRRPTRRLGGRPAG